VFETTDISNVSSSFLSINSVIFINKSLIDEEFYYILLQQELKEILSKELFDTIITLLKEIYESIQRIQHTT